MRSVFSEIRQLVSKEHTAKTNIQIEWGEDSGCSGIRIYCDIADIGEFFPKVDIGFSKVHSVFSEFRQLVSKEHTAKTNMQIESGEHSGSRGIRIYWCNGIRIYCDIANIGKSISRIPLRRPSHLRGAEPLLV